MTLAIFSDPHLGVHRAANTTISSRRILRQKASEYAMTAARMGDESACLGDLFDRYQNDEQTILRGAAVLGEVDFCLAGNHDVENRSDVVGSLQLLNSVMPKKVVMADYGTTACDSRTYGDCLLVSVPHHSSQELFEAALQGMVKDELYGYEGPSFLFLHCNYDMPWDTNDVTLNLTEEMADDLLGHFGVIVIGHEHSPRVEKKGGVVLLGNTFPISFGEIADRQVMLLNGDGTYTFETIWKKADHYVKCHYEELGSVELNDTQFLRVTGEIDVSEIGTLARSVAQVWRTNPGMIGIKTDVEITGQVEATMDSGDALVALPKLIEEELADNEDMLAMWQELSEGFERGEEAA